MAGQHYLILDLDTKKHMEYPPSALTLMGGILQKTQHGWHVYTPYYGPFHHILKLAKEHGADKQWLSIGKKRGYLFLADKDEIRIPWPVERMVIYAKKAAQDTSQSGLSIQKNNNPRSGLQEILAPKEGITETKVGIPTRNRKEAEYQASLIPGGGIVVRRNLRGHFSRTGLTYQAIKKPHKRIAK